MTLLYISIMFTLLLFYHSCTVYRKCFTFSLQTYDPNAAFCRNRMSDDGGCQALHSCTYIMNLTLILTKSVQFL